MKMDSFNKEKIVNELMEVIQDSCNYYFGKTALIDTENISNEINDFLSEDFEVEDSISESFISFDNQKLSFPVKFNRNKRNGVLSIFFTHFNQYQLMFDLEMVKEEDEFGQYDEEKLRQLVIRTKIFEKKLMDEYGWDKEKGGPLDPLYFSKFSTKRTK